MKRNIKTQVIASNEKEILPVGGSTVWTGALSDAFLTPLKMTATQYLAFKVKQFKQDKALLNFNAEITVKLSNCKTYWACSIAVTNLIK